MTASGRWTDEEESGTRDSRSRYREYEDHELVAAMRTLDVDALQEFIERFQHLVLLRARRHRIPREECKAWATEVLYDIALSISRQSMGRAPRALVPYIISACRLKVLSTQRNLAARERNNAALMDALGGEGEATVLATCSEYSVRSTYGRAPESLGLPVVLERLVSVFDEGISAEERTLLDWISQRIPYSQIADWLGISRTGAVKRVTRLRARLIEAAMRFGESLGVEDSRELGRFLRRTGSFTDADLARLGEVAGERQPGEMRRQGDVEGEDR